MAQIPSAEAGVATKAGNVRSPEEPGQARPWTEEEMAGAKPLPLPTVNEAAKVPTSGVPHAGKGETKPAGKPEDDAKPE